MTFLPILALLLSTQVSATVRTKDGIQRYSDRQDESVVLALPTDRYNCVRLPLERHGDQVAIMISCHEGNKPAFVLGATCDLTEPDANQSMLSVNVSKNDKPIQVMLMVACQTKGAEGTRL